MVRMESYLGTSWEALATAGKRRADRETHLLGTPRYAGIPRKGGFHLLVVRVNSRIGWHRKGPFGERREVHTAYPPGSHRRRRNPTVHTVLYRHSLYTLVYMAENSAAALCKMCTAIFFLGDCTSLSPLQFR